MRATANAAAALTLGVCFALLLRLPLLPDHAVMVISNLGQLAAAAAASALCWRASRRRHRRAWRALAVGVGAWAVGQLVWTYYEVVAGTAVPFPSLSDVGFLIFPVASGIGLLIWLGGQDGLPAAARGRDLLDGMIIAVSLMVLSWVTSLGAVLTDSEGGWLAVTLSVAYPVGDVILGTLVLLAIARGPAAERAVLLLLALGLGFLALADSAYVFLVASGAYTSADVISSGWVFGFLLVGVAAHLEFRTDRERHAGPLATEAPSLAASAVPYLPFGAAGLALSWSLVAETRPPAVDVTLAVTLVVLVLGRQFLAMAENQRLYVALGNARDQLQHQALHDPLTGLANRALFNDRLEHALCKPELSVGLLFCDVDDFKQVNDTYGHDIGDLVLKQLASRLTACVRAEDTVARLGGDEFAVLLERPEDTRIIAERVVAATARPFVVRDELVRVTISVGATQHRGRRRARAQGPRLTGADLLLRLADQAMYAAKTSGKGHAVVAGEEPRSPLPSRAAERASS